MALLASLPAMYGQKKAEAAPQQIAELGKCPLASGKVILDCRVGYRTFGTLNADRTNVVVMPSFLNGDSEDLIGLFGPKRGYRLVDTTK